VKRAVREHAGDFAAFLALVSFAVLVGGYILSNQRVRFPIIQPEPFTLKAEFSTGQALTPGQGQTVRVAGVRIGDITNAELENGRAIVTMEVDDEYKDLVRENATALLRPKTGLKDMFIELDPGTKDAALAKENFVIPISNTLPDVNPDEILANFDADTRSYIRLLLDGAGKGLKGRGKDLNELLRRFEPTYRDLAAVSSEVATRRTELRRLINSLARLNTTLGRKDDDLAQLVGSSSRVFEAIASERAGVSETVRRLPGALKQASSTLARVDQLAPVLQQTTRRMVPVVEDLREANRRTRPLALEAAPRLRDDIRPFVRELRPLVRDLRPAARQLADGEPGLTRTFDAINRFFNLIAYNKDGRESPDDPDRDEGYLFYTGWLVHQVNNLFRRADAHGPGRPITYGGTCAVIQNTVGLQQELEGLLGLTGALTDPAVCGGKEGGGGSLTDNLPGNLPLPRSAKGGGR
jgi:phospholipid/cholesterol/gamma-HCH transport system substrate-binding protein